MILQKQTKQEEFRKLLKEVANGKKKEVILCGYAGTGKSYCVAQELNILKEQGFTIIAPTNVACKVLNNKFNDPLIKAVTFHKAFTKNPISDLEDLLDEVIEYYFNVPVHPDSEDYDTSIHYNHSYDNEFAVSEDNVERYSYKKLMRNYILQYIDFKNSIELNHISLLPDFLKQKTDNQARIFEKEFKKILKQDSPLEFIYKEKHEMPKRVLVDECSMLDREQIKIIRDNCDSIIFVGDFAQLGPVKRTQGLNESESDICLTEIRRSENNDILKLSENARNGIYGIPKKYNIKDLLEADMVICSTHKARRVVTEDIRSHKGKNSLYPMPGEPISFSLKAAECEAKGFYKDQIVIVDKVSFSYHKDKSIKRIYFYFKSPITGETATVDIPPSCFETTDRIGNKIESHSSFNICKFGYAITVHASQGSEWDNVVFIDSWRQNPEYKKLFYTAVTRASKTIKILAMKKENKLMESI